MSLKIKRYASHGPNWYLRGTVRGQSVFETTGTDDRAAAEAIRIKREAELLQRSVFGTGATVTFAEAALSYIEHGGEARYLGKVNLATGKWSGLIGHFMSMPLNAISQEQADEAAGKLYPGTSAATRKRQAYVPLIAVLNHAGERGWLNPPRIKVPKVKERPPEWATPGYVRKLLPHCAPSLHRFVVLIVYTGVRLSEAMRIDWDMDVDLATRHITIRRTKNGKMRTCPVADALLIELAKTPEPDRHGPLFPWSDKCHVYGPLRTACRRAGLAYLSPHQLGRHTFATWLRKYAKRDLRGLMDDVGWGSIASAARYAHVTPGETEMAVDRLPNVQNPCSSADNLAKPQKSQKKKA